MELNPLHYISSPDGYSTGSENEVTKKMRRKYEKLQENGDPWWHTSDEEMEASLSDLERQVYPKKYKCGSKTSTDDKSHESKSDVDNISMSDTNENIVDSVTGNIGDVEGSYINKENIIGNVDGANSTDENIKVEEVTMIKMNENASCTKNVNKSNNPLISQKDQQNGNLQTNPFAILGNGNDNDINDEMVSKQDNVSDEYDIEKKGNNETNITQDSIWTGNSNTRKIVPKDMKHMTKMETGNDVCSSNKSFDKDEDKNTTTKVADGEIQHKENKTNEKCSTYEPIVQDTHEVKHIDTA